MPQELSPKTAVALPSPHDVERIYNDVWEAAARINPMLLTKLRSDYDFKRLREMIRDCLEQGLSAAEVHRHVVAELLRSAVSNQQPHEKCEGRHSTRQDRQKTQ